jgi:FAD/FMN-containing dehydrogenase/Fe-S oxidoreductase
MTAGLDASARALASALSQARPGLLIDTSALARSQYGYDASNYRVTPAAVAYPRDTEDVAALVRAAADRKLPVISRGSGTSMAGNAIGPGIVLDFARHMNHVLAIDPVGRTATVQAGTILDELQTHAARHRLMFGPDPSSHSRATLGGMIGNDACGNHSVAYGRTSDHVVSLEVVLADGTPAVVTGTGIEAVEARHADRVAAIERQLRQLAQDNLATLRTELDRIPRQVSGYHAHRLLPERGFDVARALVGSEGTLAIIVTATLALLDRPTHSSLVIVGYDDLIQAAEDVPTILRFGPTAIEGMDEEIVDTMRARRGPDAVAPLPAGRAWLYVEFAGADESELGETAAKLVAALTASGRSRHTRVVHTAVERAALWRVREDGAGLAANLVDGERSWPGWEDAAVAPANLAQYLREFRQLLTVHGYRGVLYGHFGAGCVHVRINFDTSTDAGLGRMRAFLLQAAGLVARHGGTLSGEHGDGRARSELLPIMYSQRLLDVFAQFKTIFDPESLLNPGIIIDPDPVQARIPLAPKPIPASFRLGHDHGDLAHAVGRCVGIGRCVAPTGGVMCPSYRATGHERDSTRGRARALQDMMSGTGTITDGFASTEVLDTLDLCLSCKACSTDCPTGTDMATYKSEFLHRHYRHRIRPISHYTLGWLPAAAALATSVAPLVNRLLALPGVRRFLPRLAGVTERRQLPTFVARRRGRALLAAIPSSGGEALLFVDTFTRAFRPELATAAARVLADAGIAVSIAPRVCCGLTWTTTGQLDTARRMLRRTAQTLTRAEHTDKPIIVLEPSCAAALAGDLPELLGTDDAHAVAARIHTFDHALHTLAAPDWSYPTLPADGVLQTHCHEHATFPAHKQSASLRTHGMSNLNEAVGCCGLAGNFGYEADHYDTSIAVAGIALTPALERAAPNAVILADGFGCRTQIEHLQPHRHPVHLAELLDDLIAAAEPATATEGTQP